ncbi:MAG TPA: signal peptide peptidase SppA [Steroidobacteraceae bacterium]|nr:signal peptide peptidase SppA [Steroidobacteraceae bacterium]
MRYLLGFFRGAWHGLDVLRRVLHLLLLLALLAVLIAGLRGSIPRLPERGALVIHPSGEIVEQLAGEPLERAINEVQGQNEPQTLLWDLTRAIRAAAGDARIQALLIDTDDLEHVGQAKLEELASAIAEFRRSGKKVVARGSYFLQGPYYLASQADEIYLDPFGFVLLPGYDRYRMYYKDAIDKLAVDVHLIRAGKFKSADEPFVRRDMSAEDRQESSVYLQSLWLGYRTAIGHARRLDPELLNSYSNGFAAAVRAAGGDTASVAKTAGLVTALRTGAEVEQRMTELVGPDDAHHSFRSVSLEDYLKVVHREEPRRHPPARAVGVIVASGEILDGNQPSGTIGGDSTTALLRRALEDEDIKAVVLRIDSPGGSVLASEQIYREVQALRAAGKPVVASMSDVAASGGYYIASPADAIYASANTITGSIGVFATIPTFDRTLAKLGVQVDGVGTTALSGSLRLDRPLKPELEQIVQAGVDHSYDAFLQHVAAGRHQSRDAINEIAQGRVWAGSDARRLGLVDTLGNYDDAVKEAARRAKLGKDYEVRIVEPELSFTEQLLLNMRAAIARLARAAGLGWGGASAGVVARLAPQLAPLQREVRLWQRFSRVPGRTVAYCFCAVD